MADSGDNNYKEALNLLTQAVGILESSNSEMKSADITSSEGKSPLTTSSTHGTSSEMSRLFPFFRSRSTTSSTSGSGRFSRRPAPYLKPKETWTHNFICLAEKDVLSIPGREEKISLKESGLGEKKIVFSDKKGNFAYIQGVLETQFPKLKAGGGFELLRSCGGRRQLELITMPAHGYDIPYLKQILGQAIAYIRPLQRDLDMSPVPEAEATTKESFQDSPHTVCMNCSKKVPLPIWRRHEQTCGGGSSCATEQVQGSAPQEYCRSPVTESPPKERDTKTLKEMFPNEKEKKIQEALSDSNGDLNKAASILAGWGEDDKDQSNDQYHNFDASWSPFSDAGKDTSNTLCKSMFGSVSDTITAYRSQVERGTNFIEVNRMQLSLLRQLMRIYKDPSFNFKKRIDVNFIGEQGADMGGPTKEYFLSAMSCLSKVDPAFNIQLFGGLPGHLIPLYGVDAISSGCFEMSGKLIAHSILHGGPGFFGLAPAITKYLCTGSLDESKHLVTVDDLYDLELKQILQEQVMDKTLQDLGDDHRSKIEEQLVRHGLTDVPLTDFNKEKAVNDLLIAEVLVTRTLALDTLFKVKYRSLKKIVFNLDCYLLFVKI